MNSHNPIAKTKRPPRPKLVPANLMIRVFARNHGKFKPLRGLSPREACATRTLIMPDALDLLTTRRSFKAIELAGPAPSAAEIDTLLTVASRVPDHGKLTPWRFIVFEGEARRSAGAAIAAAFRAKYPDAKPELVEAERARLLRAPLVIAVVSRAAPHVKIPEWEQVLSAGAAAISLVLTAHAL